MSALAPPARRLRAAPAASASAWSVFAVVVLGAFMAQLDLFIVNIAFPTIAHDFSGVSDASLSWVLNAYAIVFAALLVPAGRLADLIGRRRTFELGIVVFALGSVVCAAAPGVGVLIAARVVQAAGAAMVIPTSMGIMLQAFPPAERAGATGAWASVAAIAATLGPPLGGVLILLSWRWIFLVNLPVAALALIGSRRLVPADDGHRDGNRPDLLGATLLIGGVGGVVLAIVEGQAWGWGSVPFVAVIVASVALLGAFLRRCETHDAPIVELSLLKVKPFAVSNAAMFMFSAGFGAGLLLAVLFLTRVWGQTPLMAGLMIAPGPAIGAALSPFTKRLVLRFGARPVGVAGSLCVVFAAAWLATHAHVRPDFAGAFLPAMVAIGLGAGLQQPTLFGVVAGVLPPNRFATGAGVLNMARQISLALGVAVAIAILGATPALAGFHASWWFMAGTEVGAALLSLLLPGAAARRFRT